MLRGKQAETFIIAVKALAMAGHADGLAGANGMSATTVAARDLVLSQFLIATTDAWTQGRAEARREAEHVYAELKKRYDAERKEQPCCAGQSGEASSAAPSPSSSPSESASSP